MRRRVVPWSRTAYAETRYVDFELVLKEARHAVEHVQIKSTLSAEISVRLNVFLGVGTTERPFRVRPSVTCLLGRPNPGAGGGRGFSGAA